MEDLSAKREVMQIVLMNAIVCAFRDEGIDEDTTARIGDKICAQIYDDELYNNLLHVTAVIGALMVIGGKPDV